MRPVDNKNAAPHPIYDTTFDNSTGTLLLQIQELTHNVNTGTNASYNFFRNGLDFNGAVPILMGNNIGLHQAGGIQTVMGVNVRPNMADVAVLTPNTVIYRQTYQAPARTILIPNRWQRRYQCTNSGNRISYSSAKKPTASHSPTNGRSGRISSYLARRSVEWNDRAG
jgi:hypothetical protein